MSNTKDIKLLQQLGRRLLTQHVDDNIVDQVKDNFLHCTGSNCGNSKAQPIGIYNAIALLLRCEHCEAEWLMCTHNMCLASNRQRHKIMMIQAYNKHVRNVHKKKKKLSSAATNVAVDEIDFETTISPPEDTDFGIHTDHQVQGIGESEQLNAEVITNDEILCLSRMLFGRSQTIDWIECKNSVDLGFVGDNNIRYFQEQLLSHKFFGGLVYLAKRTLTRQNLHPIVAATKANLMEEKAFLQVRAAKLAFSLEERHNKLLVEVMTACHNLGVEGGYNTAVHLIGESFKDWSDCNRPAITSNLSADNFIAKEISKPFTPELVLPHSTNSWDNRLPKNINEVKKQLLTGANAIIRNIPCPSVKTDVPGHSYVSVEDCMRDFLGHHQERRLALLVGRPRGGYMHNLNAAVLHPSESTHAREIMQQLEIKVSIQGQMLKCYVIWWEDDVEPNRLSKVGQGSIWVLTMMIGTILGDGHNMNNTYPIAVGKKGENHNAITWKIENEMREIRKGKEYYIGSIKKKARIQFSDFAHLADQPECRSINHLAAGNATYAARFGVSANHKECFGVLKACEWCDKSNQS